MMRALACVVLSLVLSACGGRNFREITPAETKSTPPYLDLRSEHSVGTLHFPQGTYVLNAVDDKGYYYRAPRKIVQHTFAGSVRRDGGIFVEKRDPDRLRGYVAMPGGLTHVGNLSHADHEFQY